jgi:hypothetical protein
MVRSRLSHVGHKRPEEAWHDLLDVFRAVRTGDDATVELLDVEFGDQLEAEWLPLADVEYDEHADKVSVGPGGRDGRYPVVLGGSRLPFTVQIMGADGSETLATVPPRGGQG